MSSFTGSLAKLSLAALFRFLEQSQRTGTLVAERQTENAPERAQFVFEEGRLVGARTLRTKPLGDLLIQAREITPQELADALAVQRRASPRVPLGEILVRADALSRPALEGVLAEQIRDGVADVTSWSDGDFEFFEEAVRSREGFALDGAEDLPPAGLPALRVVADAERVFSERSVRDTQPVPILESTESTESAASAAAVGAAAEDVATDPADAVTEELPVLSAAESAALAGPDVSEEPVDGHRPVERLEHLRAQASTDGVSLALLRLIAESFERGLLLEPRAGRLSVLGAFGNGRAGLLSSLASRGLQVELPPGRDLAGYCSSDGWRGAEARRWLPARLVELLPEEDPAEALLLSLVAGGDASGGGELVALVFAESDVELPKSELAALQAARRDLAAALRGQRPR
jgi:hypothetical protein